MKTKKYKEGGGRPKIGYDDIDGPNGAAVIVTIAGVEEEKVKGDDGDKSLLTLVTEEYGDKVHRLNKTQIVYLEQRLGDETDAWVGERIPLQKKRQGYGKETFNVVWVSAPEDWADLLAGDEDSAPVRRRAVTAKAKTKRK